MIIQNIEEASVPLSTQTLRVREEREGGRAFDVTTREIYRLTEQELVNCQLKAENSDDIVYYSVRNWSDIDLSDGCASSPTRIYLELTQQCNLMCLMCFREGGQPASCELNTEEMCRLLGNLWAIGVFELRFTGGEPTLRPDFLTLLDQALGMGFYVSLGTNGVWEASLTEAVLDRKIDRFLVSLEGVETVNDLLRGKGSFKRTLNTIDRLIEAGKNVRVNTILCTITLDGLRALAKLCREHEVRKMALIVPRPMGRASQLEFREYLPSHKDIAVASRMLKPILDEYGVNIEFQYDVYRNSRSSQGSDPVVQKIIQCPAGSEAAFVSPDGWLYACGCSTGWSGDKKFAAGNIVSLQPHEIWEMWQTSKVWGSFRDLRLSKVPACFKCKAYGRGCFGSCPIHSYAATGSFSGPDPMCCIPLETESNCEVN